MSDIATLGIKVDASQVTAGTTALDRFAAAAKPAADGAAKFESSILKASSSASKLSSEVAKLTGSTLSQALRGFSNDLDKFVEQQNKGTASTGLARHEMINLSRQIQDVGVSLASGQSPFTVLVQQGTQIADIFGSSKTGTVGGAIKQVTSGIASFLTPARLLGGGIAAVGLAGYAAYQSWKAFALALDDTAKQAGVTTGEMAKLQAAASFKGIGNEDSSKAFASFSQQVYLAKQNAGGLLDVFRANGQQVTTFTGSLEKAADLIQRASSDQQRLVLLGQMGLPANMQWVRLLEQGSAGLARLKGQTNEFGSAANDNMVAKAREFDEAWNKAWTNFGLGWKSAFVGAGNMLDTLIQKGRQGLMAAGVDVGGNLLKNGLGYQLGGVNDEFYNATGAKGRTDPNKTKDPNAVRNAIAQESAYTAVLDKLLTPAQMLAEMQQKLHDAAKTKGADHERKQHRTLAAA